MSRLNSSAVAAQPAAVSDLVNRRVSIRYPAGASTITAVVSERCSPFKKARVHDVSQGGIALVLREAPQVGDLIYLQLTNRILDFSFDLAAEVRHLTPTKRGAWIVGLQFDQALSPAELAALL